MANQYPLFISTYANFPGASNSLDQALSFYTTTAVLNAELAGKVDVTSGTATNLTVNTGMRLPFAAAGLLQVDGSGVVSGGGGGGAGAGLASNNTFTGTNNFTAGLAQNSNAFNIGGALTTGAAFTTTPANALTLTTSGATNVTLPTTGTLAALGGTNAWTAANSFTGATSVSGVTFTVSMDSTAYGTAALLVRNVTNTNNQLYMGYNSSTNAAYIQGFTQGTGTRPLLLNPSGGNVCINSTASPISLASSFTTSGANALTLTTTGATNITLPTTGRVPAGTTANSIFFTTVGATTLTLPVTGNVPSGTAGNAINFTTTGVTTLALPTTGTVATLEGANTWSTSNNFQGTLQQAGRGLILGSGTDSLALQTSGNTTLTLPTSGTLATLTGVQTWGGSQNFAQSGLSQAGRVLILGSNTDSLQLTTTGNTNVTLPTTGTLATTTAANSWSSTNDFTGGLSQNGNAFNVGGALTTGAAFTTTPANALTLTTAGATNVTLPTTGTLAALGNTNAWTGANTWAGATTFNVMTTVGVDSTSYGTAALLIRNATNTNNQLYMGYNSSTNAAYIQGFTQSTGVRPLLLNPSGGNVCINSTSSPISLASSFTTSGANALTLTTTGPTNVTLPTSGTLLTSTTLLAGTNSWTANNNFTAGLQQNGNTISLASSFTTSGANALTLTTTGPTNVTLPTSGTLLTSTTLLSGSNTWSANNNFTGGLQQNGNNMFAADRANVYWLSTSATSTVSVSSIPTNIGTRITNVSNTLTLAAGSKYTLEGTIIGVTNTANSGQFVTFTISGATGVTVLPNTTSNSSTFAGYNLVGTSQPQMAISFTMFIDGTSASGAFAVTPTQTNWNGTKIEIMGKVVTDN